MDKHLQTKPKDTEQLTAANTGFASGGLTCKLGALCFYSSSVLIDSFGSETRPNAKPENVSGNCRKMNRRK